MLDEPANGLDPQGIRWLRDFLRGLASEGRAILVSSHVLAEVAQTADDVVVISRGKSVAQAPLADIMARSSATRRSARSRARTSAGSGTSSTPRASRSAAPIAESSCAARAERTSGASSPRTRSSCPSCRRSAPRSRTFLRAHGVDGGPVMTRIISAELFKMRTTRTFYALVGSALAARPAAHDPDPRVRQLRARRRSPRRPAVLHCRARSGLRAPARDPRRDERVPPRDDHAEPARGPEPRTADAVQAGRRAAGRARARASSRPG